jgi:hypothetical protein
MGHLHYDRSTFVIEDRILSHLQVVVTQKMRRHDSFMLTFSHTERGAEVSNSIWVSHNSHLHFAFSGSRHPELNKQWLEALMAASNSTTGLDVDRIPEPDGRRLTSTA